ncbi:MAG: rhomboid family intramembrane serine protease [Armatimonadota bacterium]|nr:rhomboid family intramembrane serine protease [Armatimonadota bacterium]
MSVPISDRTNKKRPDFPIVTLALIALNVVAYIVIALAQPDDQREIYRLFGLTARDAQFFNMFTSLFLHSDAVHLVTNMIFLWLFGRSLERVLGAVEYLILFVGCGLFAAVTHLAIVYAFMPPDAATQPALGASGAIAGILGVYAIRFCRNKFQFLGLEVPSSLLLLAWLMLQVFLGILSLYIPNPKLQNVDYWAHMGGFMFGIMVAHLTNLASVGRKEYLVTDAENSFIRGTLLDVVRKYESLLRYDANDPFANAELGRTWALLEDQEQALPYYHAAINLYLKSGKGADAALRYQELHNLLPDAALPSDTLYRLGCYFEEAGKASEALSALNEICSFRVGEVQCEMAMLKVAQIQMSQLNQPILAVSTLEKFLELYPNSEWRRFAEQTLEAAHIMVES